LLGALGRCGCLDSPETIIDPSRSDGAEPSSSSSESSKSSESFEFSDSASFATARRIIALLSSCSLSSGSYTSVDLRFDGAVVLELSFSSSEPSESSIDLCFDAGPHFDPCFLGAAGGVGDRT